ncbi:MAG: circadian clock KaiB family protein [Casimicrobiaceae bacterium]
MDSARHTFKFQLYVAGDSPNSVQALANLKSICNTAIVGQYEIDIIDVFRDPERAAANGVLMTPTLIKLEPSPVRRIVGSLRDRSPVLEALGLPAGEV